jgi:1-acyl-sn-glycerol-3-phosphate acyltransferase
MRLRLAAPTLGAPDWPRERLWLWRLGFPPVRALALFLAPARIEGLAGLPRQGAYIVVANHVSWIDPPWIAFALNTAVRYMAKEEVFRIPVVGGVLRAVGCFPIRRGSADRRALVTALRVLAAGQPLGFFPEGHRSDTGALIRAHPGIGMLAVRSGAPLVPIGVIGSDRARLGRFWRRDITVRIGPSFRASELGVSGDQEVADAIMRRIATLLPPPMRGMYT